MNLYLLTQNKVTGIDTYDSCVVSAESEDDARKMHPNIDVTHVSGGDWMGTFRDIDSCPFEYTVGGDPSWPQPSELDCIEVKFLGNTLVPKCVICASFNPA